MDAKMSALVKEFAGTKYELLVRPGKKAGWWEMLVTKPDGSVLRMIGKKVDRFLSEEADTL